MLLPVGHENFQEVVEKKSLDFVDKTLLIKEVLDDEATKVAVITRPRRFGKTFNLSMLHCFLSNTVGGLITTDLFDTLKIADCGDEYMCHQGQYPVISISFKDVKSSNYPLCYQKLRELMSRIYYEHRSLLDSTKLSSHQKEVFNRILREEASESAIHASLYNLTNYLYLEHQVKPWLLIDEYDTPIQAGYVNGYYKESIDLMRGVLGAALKGNLYLEKAIVTGILRIAKESLFSGVNNLEVYSLLRDEYSQHFGFTELEVNHILEKSNLSAKSAEIKAWYNGYQFGNTIVYNPWSIANCIKRRGELEPYWVNTSDNQLIKDLLKKSPLSFKESFELLLRGESTERFVDEDMVFHYLNDNVSSVWTLLLMSGYLKSVFCRKTDQGILANLEIPNKEVRNLYRQIIEQWLSNGYGIEWYNAFIEALLSGNMTSFKKHLDQIVVQIASFHDFAKEPEAFYHGLMLGLIASLHTEGTYEIKSNRESGLGRFDIMLIPKDRERLGVIIELKAATEKESLTTVAQGALKQIDNKKYHEEMKSRDTEKFIKIGIGFRGKDSEISYTKEPAENKNTSHLKM